MKKRTIRQGFWLLVANQRGSWGVEGVRPFFMEWGVWMGLMRTGRCRHPLKSASSKPTWLVAPLSEEMPTRLLLHTLIHTEYTLHTHKKAFPRRPLLIPSPTTHYPIPLTSTPAYVSVSIHTGLRLRPRLSQARASLASNWTIPKYFPSISVTTMSQLRKSTGN